MVIGPEETITPITSDKDPAGALDQALRSWKDSPSRIEPVTSLADEIKAALGSGHDVTLTLKIDGQDGNSTYWLPLIGGEQTGETEEHHQADGKEVTLKFRLYRLRIPHHQEPRQVEIPDQHLYGYLQLDFWNARNEDGYRPKEFPHLVLPPEQVLGISTEEKKE